MKVFIGYADVAGFASRLASLLARAGHEVEILNSFPNPHNPSRTGREGLRAFVDRFGMEGLRFSARPDLEQRVVELLMDPAPQEAPIEADALMRAESN